MQGYFAVKSGRHDWGNDIFETCSEQGFTGVLHWRSYMAHNGLGRPESAEEATEWDRKAAETGDPIGQFNYGLDLLRGHGMTWRATRSGGVNMWIARHQRVSTLRLNCKTQPMIQRQ